MFPQIAFKHPFVMRLLLGLSALHIAYLRPEERLRHVGEASRYHNQSLDGFNEALKQPPQEISDALFTWSSLNLLYVFGIHGRLGEGLWDDSERGSRKDRLLGLSWVPMLRGVRVMLDPCFFELRDGPLRELLHIGNFQDLDLDQHTHPDDQCFRRVREVWKNYPDAQIYEDTLQVLRRCHMFMEQFSSMESESPGESVFDRSWQGAFLLVPFAPEEYFTLLQQRQPPALVLYAFYGALLHRFVNDSWFMEGWGQDIVDVVADLLGSYWREWIAWPLQVVGVTS
ncbi:sterol uptake control protein 2 [Fusarium langsethiae]|uniref:Sterol uptake control protein 2 n=1 Tax=Fusarium langsethiae TaxID=179993 RepID=A0A0M9EP85_FUSLA|nr:sterol uptake control protein 2 [Fusarium langsethiae]